MFESARLKIERADHHIRNLKSQFAAFVNSNPYALAVGNNPNTGQFAVRINFRKNIPAEWALIIGDAIHKLHTALDHMTWEVIGRDGGTQDRYVKFPVGDSRQSFESLCNGIKTPSSAVKDALKALEAFPGGKGNNLHALHHLDIADKHAALMPVVRSAKVSKFVIYHENGAPQSTWTNNTFIGGGGFFTDIADVPPGGYVELDNEATITPDIFLGELPHNIGNIPVFPMLTKFRREVSKTVDTIESQTS